MNSDIASLRTADIELRLNSYEGIKMPASAVHVNNGEKRRLCPCGLRCGMAQGECALYSGRLCGAFV